jgi:antitoxin component HigA of HigAB toxin-antitoxin module
MKKILEGVTRITTPIEFDLLMNHIETLISEATEGGYFSDPDESNEYTQGIARLGKIGARYEDEFLCLSINGNPLISEIEQVLQYRGLTQKKAAELMGVTEPTFSDVIRGKKSITMRMAKRLFSELNIDPQTIIQYA